ncbi:DNA-directed RNA polymerase subunit H [Halocatena salina]|uniref:DNA-directed RNA polymerase subunit Rpo5 n=1 Tax=Halocatena salina TaxID=2934340 RepID=A0A8U0A4U2_9EURY|nr:DNA-directed RNA polymerase subunit H [Halocatena salina]UPM44054.1 DNA-directed RNA polymerase subunit H [Halocatena salina]
MVDATEHELVPEHSLVDEETLEGVLDEYNIDRTDLPKIKRRDPALADIDAEAGDVIRIVRDSRTAERAVIYRLVIE